MKKANNVIKLQIQIFFCAMLIVLVGCQSSLQPPEEITDALDEAIIEKSTLTPAPLQKIPNAIKQELMQKETHQARRSLLAEKRISIATTDLDANQFFSAIIEDSPYSIAIHPDVAGKITLNLKDVTLDEILKVIESLYGYDIRRQGQVIQVYPSGIRTETIAVDYLYVKRNGSSSTSINSAGVSEQGSSGSGSSRNGSSNSSSQNGSSQNGSSNGGGRSGSGSGVNVSTETESDFWGELQEALTVLVGEKEGYSVIVSPQAGLVTITALPAEIDAVRRFLNSTQEHLRRQVIIEAKIMEVTLNDDYQQGVQWGNVLGHIESTDISLSTTGNIANNVIASSIGGLTSISFRNADFTNVINLLSTQGNVQVLSSPRITATNNQKAIIKVGEDEFFVTDISNTTTTGTATTSTPDVELTPFFSGIALDVTPQIDNNGEVILHVHPSVTTTDEQIKVISLGADSFSLPLAQSNIRESDTIIRANSGEIVIIGGLIETRNIDLESKTPLLGNIPILGELFKNKSQATQKKELVIMLKPTVVTQDVWKNQLQDARTLLKKWFPENSTSTLDKN